MLFEKMHITQCKKSKNSVNSVHISFSQFYTRFIHTRDLFKSLCLVIVVFKAGEIGKVYASKKICYQSCPDAYLLPKLCIGYTGGCGCQLKKSIIFLMFSIHLTRMLPFRYCNYDHLSAARHKTSKLSFQYDLANELILLLLEVIVS